MSMHAMTIVWKAGITPPSLKLCALALADWSNDEGGSLHPSMAAIARKVGVSRPQAQRLIRELKSAGMLVVVANAKGGAPTTTPHYRLKLERIAALTGITGDAGTGITDAQERASPMHRTGIVGDAQTTIEPSVNQEKAAARRPTPLTSKTKTKTEHRKGMTLDAWLSELDDAVAVPPSDTIFEYAKRIDLPSDFLELAWLAFKHRYTEIQPTKTYTDWRAVFRRVVRENWMNLWYADPAGGYRLTTSGTQALREQDAAQHSPEEVDHA